MAIFIGIGLAGLSAQAGTAAPPAVGVVAAVAPMPVASAVFDSGAARGGNAADIPLSGTTDAADGAQIEARIVRADTGVQVHPWTVVATAAGGAWSGAFPAVPRSVHWLKAEVRVRSSAAAAGTMDTRFAVGHVWAFWGQSNESKFAIFDSPVGLTPDTLTHPDDVQVWIANRNGLGAAPTQRVLNNALGGNLLPGIARFANVFSAHRPGEKVAIAVHALPDVRPWEMINPADTSRVWEDDVALHEGITAHGTDVGLVLNFWTSFSPNNVDAMLPIMTQKRLDGTPVALGATITTPQVSYVLHHSFAELYDLTETRMGFLGTTGRSLGNGPFSHADQAQIENAAAVGIAAGWRNVMADKVKFPEMLDYQWDPQTVALRGRPDGSGGWTDTTHFSNQSDSGFPYLGEIYANQIMRMTGMIDFDIPEITHSDWTPTHIDVWNPDHDIDTRRNLQGGTSPFVRGFIFAGKIMTTEAQLIANAGGSGRQGVRITPAGGVSGDEILLHGVGPAPGLAVAPGDYQANYVLDLPVMDMGQAGSVALPVRARQQTPFVSNLVTSTPFIDHPLFTGSGYFKDPNTLGGGVTGITIAGDMRVFDTTSGVLATTSNGLFTLEILSGGRFRWAGSITGSTSDGIFIPGRTTADNTLAVGNFTRFVWTSDLTADGGVGRTSLWINGSLVSTQPHGAPATQFQSTRTLEVLSNFSSAPRIDYRYLNVYKRGAASVDANGLPLNGAGNPLTLHKNFFGLPDRVVGTSVNTIWRGGPPLETYVDPNG